MNGFVLATRKIYEWMMQEDIIGKSHPMVAHRTEGCPTLVETIS